MVKINIDGKDYEVEPKDNLLQTLLSLKIDVPYFCWHPAMGSVGSCRQCAVKKYADEKDTKGRIVMSCMEPVVDGMRISVDDPEVKQFRANLIELTMTDHPHDCPVCDEGGECHLQDVTLMSGHNYRRYEYNKRTHKNQYLGPFINHEMNRCIACYRCVRFYRDYAGGRDFNVFASRNRVYFGRYEDGVLQNEFSGNLIEVCPTGVFTDKTFKEHYTRKWDLTTAPTICQNCSLGCNIIAGERYGTIRRITSRYNEKVNGYFICDRGRFGYEYVNSDLRLREPLRRGQASGQLEEVDQETVFNYFEKLFKKNARFLGIGSPRASLEANHALQMMVGKDNFFAGVNEVDQRLTLKALQILRESPAEVPSLRETENADVVVVLGEDVTNTAPMLALSLRQASRKRPLELPEKMHIPTWNERAVDELLQDERGPFFVLTPTETKLDDIATATYRQVPQNIARLAQAVAHYIDPEAPEVSALTDSEKALAKQIGDELLNAKQPLIVSGTSLQDETLLEGAANIAIALKKRQKTPWIFLTLPEANSAGLALLDEKNLNMAFEKALSEKYDALIVLENDLYRRLETDKVDKLLDAFEHIIVLHYLQNPTTDKANLIVPVGPFTETDGTMVNNECRAQRYFQVFYPGDTIKESWRWLGQIMAKGNLQNERTLNNLDEFIDALIQDYPQLSAVKDAAPDASFRIAGQKIPRQSHRYSGRTSMLAHINVSEPKPPEDPDTPMSFTMEGYQGPQPGAVLSRYWYPGWNSVQALNKFQIEVGGGLHDGKPGERVLDLSAKEGMSYFTQIPEPFAAQENNFLGVPLYHIFGSEELSIHTKGVAELTPKPYILLNEADTEGLGDQVKVQINDRTVELELRKTTVLPKGAAGLPVGLPDMGAIKFPVWIKISG